MRKYDGKNKRNIGIIVGVCIIFAVIFSYFLFQQIKLSRIKYELDTGTVLFDIDKNNILLNGNGTVKKKWNKKYYLTYEDEQYNIGTHVIAFNNNSTSLALYGEFYEIKENSNVDITKEETIINNLGVSRFYKLADRKYLLIDPDIRTSDESLKTPHYLIVELDKQGNAILYNNSLNVKVFSATKILTSTYTFDIANELLIYENETIDLKKIIGTTNEYEEKEEPNDDKINIGNQEDGNGTGTGNGTGAGNGIVGGNVAGGNVDNNQGNGTGNGEDLITGEDGPNIGDSEIINQTAYTSIIRINPSINSIDVDYVIYDKLNQYLSTFVEINSNKGSNKVYLSKSSTHINLSSLTAGTDYELVFKYTHYSDGIVKEETIDTHNVTTLLPSVTLVGTKVTSKKIDYKISISSHSIDSAKLRLYIGGEKQDRELSIDSTKMTGSFNISGLSFPPNVLVELKLEDVYAVGARINKNISWSYKTPGGAAPEEPESPSEPENPKEPVVPEEPKEPETPEIDTPNEEESGE